jgi:hypothetical protein
MAEPKPERRVVVFIDYQNVYEDFRRAFVTGTLLPTHGQFHPIRLGQLLADRGPDFEAWRLSGVRVYTGHPAPNRNPRGAGAADRQIQAWRDAGAVVRHRPLQYLPGQPARQKGVDVELAVDVVSMAHEKQFEIAIVASTDTDLVPALEAVQRYRGLERVPRVCVVSFEGLQKKLQLPDTRATQPYCFRLTRAEYASVHDPTIYAGDGAARGTEAD